MAFSKLIWKGRVEVEEELNIVAAEGTRDKFNASATKGRASYRSVFWCLWKSSLQSACCSQGRAGFVSASCVSICKHQFCHKSLHHPSVQHHIAKLTIWRDKMLSRGRKDVQKALKKKKSNEIQQTRSTSCQKEFAELLLVIPLVLLL